MADVNGLGRAPDRGQMLVVVAFGVAVMLVALALILNTAIYTENISTRGSDISGGQDAIQYRASTHEMLVGTVQYVNRNNNSSYDHLERNVRFAVWNYSNASGRQQAGDGIVTRTTVEKQTSGTHVYNSSGNFSDVDGDSNWTVAETANGVRSFTLEADRSTLAGDDPPPVESEPVFHVNFSDAGDDEFYRVYIYNDTSVGSDEANVTVEGQTDDGETFKDGCERDWNGDTLDVDITGATVDGERCGPLEHVANVTSDPFGIAFNNTYDAGNGENTIEGNYSMVVWSDYDHTAEDAPSRSRAIYAATVKVVYETKRLYFKTDIQAAPGEFDD